MTTTLTDLAELTDTHAKARAALAEARAVMATTEAVHGEWSPEWEAAQKTAAEAVFAERAARLAVKAAGGVPVVTDPIVWAVSPPSTRERFDDVPLDVMAAARRAGRVM